MDNNELQNALSKLGQHITTPIRLYLIGGSALTLLGSPRQTIDIDFIGSDLPTDMEHQALLQAARELNIFLEPVPLERFIPLPKGDNNRAIRIGQFNNLEIYVADPYSIALSKLDRGFDTDLDDIIFLIQHGYIEIETLKQTTKTALQRAREFDINPSELQAHLQIVQERLK